MAQGWRVMPEGGIASAIFTYKCICGAQHTFDIGALKARWRCPCGRWHRYRLSVEVQAQPGPDAKLPALSPRQADTLKAIETLTTEGGYSPSMREIGDRIGVTSSCTVFRHVEALIRKGYVASRKPGASRALIVLHPADLDAEE